MARSRLESLKSLRISNWDVAFSTAFITLTTGAFLVGFAKSIGATPFLVNLLVAIPSLCGALQVPGAIWGRGFPFYKRFVTPGGWLWRIAYLPLIALPLLPVSDGVRLGYVILAVGVASAVISVVNPIYTDWVAEMVPPDSRGSYYGRRNAISPAVGAAAGLVGAMALDAFRDAGHQALGFSFVFAFGLVCAGISMFAYLRMSDFPRLEPVKQSFTDSLRAIRVPFADREYRKVLVYLVASLFAQTLPGGLFALFAIEKLHLDYKIIQLTAVMYAVGILISSRVWGFVSDRYGNKPVLVLCGALIALNPIPWIMCPPEHPVVSATILIIAHFFMGFSWSGVNLCQFNILLATAKPEDRANYLAAGTSVSALVSGLAPLLGAALLPHNPTADAFKIVFGVTCVLRVIAVLFLIPVREGGSRGIRDTLRNLSQVTPRSVRAMRSLANSGDVSERSTALQSVGAGRFSMAGDAVIKSLHDPQPRIRRQAAAALAKLDDPRAVTELLHQLEEHPDLVEEETLDALGELRDAAAVPLLLPMLQSPRSILRRASARALGKIGSELALPALMAVAEDNVDSDLRRSALQALRQIGSIQSSSSFVKAVLDPAPSVRIAAAEAVAEMEILEAGPNLRLSLEKFDDEACAEIAYALGAVGGTDDVTHILAEAGQTISVITRRRCLLGAARVLGVEQPTYRLMILEGMERDTVLLGMLQNATRKTLRIQSALERYSSGDEAGALHVLAKQVSDPGLQMLADQPISESFLVAACRYLLFVDGAAVSRLGAS